MLRKLIFLLASATVLASSPNSPQKSLKSHDGDHHWSYSGKTGPAHWAELDPAFSQCAQGQQQSPVNIGMVYTQALEPLAFQYQASRIAVINNGHTIQHDYDPGSFLAIGAASYQLLQLHFHTPSEESIGGQRAPMDIHLVHRNANNELAVLAVQIEQGGADNPVFREIWRTLPREENVISIYTARQFNVADLLPAQRAYWTFMGSLTTPPCSEGVRWLVLKEPIKLSARQIAQFRKHFKANARPVQPLNQRAILDSQ